MSKFSEFMDNKSVSKGGVLGGIIGALLSTRSYSPADNTIKKVGKTGLFAAVGYFIGTFIEKLFSGKTRKNTF